MSSNGDVRSATQYEHLRIDVVRPQGMEFKIQDATTTSKKATPKKREIKVEQKSTEKTEVKPEKLVLPVKKAALEDKVELPERREELFKIVQKFVESESETVFK